MSYKKEQKGEGEEEKRKKESLARIHSTLRQSIHLFRMHSLWITPLLPHVSGTGRSGAAETMVTSDANKLVGKVGLK